MVSQSEVSIKFLVPLSIFLLTFNNCIYYIKGKNDARYVISTSEIQIACRKFKCHYALCSALLNLLHSITDEDEHKNTSQSLIMSTIVNIEEAIMCYCKSTTLGVLWQVHEAWMHCTYCGMPEGNIRLKLQSKSDRVCTCLQLQWLLIV